MARRKTAEEIAEELKKFAWKGLERELKESERREKLARKNNFRGV